MVQSRSIQLEISLEYFHEKVGHGSFPNGDLRKQIIDKNKNTNIYFLKIKEKSNKETMWLANMRNASLKTEGGRR